MLAPTISAIIYEYSDAVSGVKVLFQEYSKSLAVTGVPFDQVEFFLSLNVQVNPSSETSQDSATPGLTFPSPSILVKPSIVLFIVWKDCWSVDLLTSKDGMSDDVAKLRTLSSLFTSAYVYVKSAPQELFTIPDT